MKRLSFLLAPFALAACSEAQVDEQDDKAVAEIEKEIEREAQSLEEAADEAVKILDDEINAELADEGVGAPEVATPSPAE